MTGDDKVIQRRQHRTRLMIKSAVVTCLPTLDNPVGSGPLSFRAADLNYHIVLGSDLKMDQN